MVIFKPQVILSVASRFEFGNNAFLPGQLGDVVLGKWPRRSPDRKLLINLSEGFGTRSYSRIWNLKVETTYCQFINCSLNIWSNKNNVCRVGKLKTRLVRKKWITATLQLTFVTWFFCEPSHDVRANVLPIVRLFQSKVLWDLFSAHFFLF